MSRISHQIIRDGAARWIIWQIEDRQEYEQIGRVVFEDGLYYVDLPVWKDDGFTWDRQPRGWVLKDGAIKSVTSPKIGAKA